MITLPTLIAVLAKAKLTLEIDGSAGVVRVGKISSKPMLQTDAVTFVETTLCKEGA